MQSYTIQLTHLCMETTNMFYCSPELCSTARSQDQSHPTLPVIFCNQKADGCFRDVPMESLLVDLPERLLNKLQRAQNNAAGIVFRMWKAGHVTSPGASLAASPSSIDYKMATLCYPCPSIPVTATDSLPPELVSLDWLYFLLCTTYHRGEIR